MCPFVKQNKTAEKPEGNEPPDLNASYKNTGDKGGHRMTHGKHLSALGLLRTADLPSLSSWALGFYLPSSCQKARNRNH